MSLFIQEIRDYSISFVNWIIRKDLTENYPPGINPKLKFLLLEDGVETNAVFFMIFRYLLKLEESEIRPIGLSSEDVCISEGFSLNWSNNRYKSCSMTITH